ncbi:heparan-alpha-glucosaminide N-acetyltransferase domain-containing protein [Rheinheimera sp.]|uniref:acyltransferase family protein n=1 Tax=Rheinheimera sp. TaxID=1869214 RepID=UPI00307D6D1B
MSASRFYALDALRGLAIALMILVNTPGSWAYVYSPLLHAAWDGFTFADLVFPTFLFVVGASMYFSLSKLQPGAAAVWRISERALKLIALGILLNYLPFTEPLAELRLPGVLQRIGLAYWAGALLVLYLPKRALWPSAALLVFGYWALLLLGSAEPYSLEHNLVRQLDLAVFGAAHLYQGFGMAFDPEGLLSTLPCVTAVILGYATVLWLKKQSQQQAVRGLTLAGVALIVLALCWHWLWPINKALWSGSYLALSTGLILCLLAALVWLVDIKGQQQLASPLTVYGTNPLFIYVLSWVWAVVFGLITVQGADGTISAYQWTFLQLASLMPEKLASLLFALAHVVGFWALSLWLYKRNIIIKL